MGMSNNFMKVTTLRINVGTSNGNLMSRIARDAKMSSHVLVFIDYVQGEISDRTTYLNYITRGGEEPL